jgi:hypothetical protein
MGGTLSQILGDENMSEKFSAEMEFRKIDPWSASRASTSRAWRLHAWHSSLRSTEKPKGSFKGGYLGRNFAPMLPAQGI